MTPYYESITMKGESSYSRWAAGTGCQNAMTALTSDFAGAYIMPIGIPVF